MIKGILPIRFVTIGFLEDFGLTIPLVGIRLLPFDSLVCLDSIPTAAEPLRFDLAGKCYLQVSRELRRVSDGQVLNCSPICPAFKHVDFLFVLGRIQLVTIFDKRLQRVGNILAGLNQVVRRSRLNEPSPCVQSPSSVECEIEDRRQFTRNDFFGNFPSRSSGGISLVA